MKYFIDFEASQFIEEIISVGCVRSDGEKFYRLVKPRMMSKVTKFIQELTGITREMLAEADDSDTVFAEMYDWLAQDTSKITFYSYSDSDLHFAKHNLTHCTNDFKAQAALSLIVSNLVDYSVVVQQHFRLSKPIALKKVMHYFEPQDKREWHNALADAEMLRIVHKHIRKNKRIKGVPFPDYIGTVPLRTDEDFKRFDIQRIDAAGNIKMYQTIDVATDMMYKSIIQQGNTQCALSTVKKNIKHAINTKKKYCGYTWIACIKQQNIKR